MALLTRSPTDVSADEGPLTPTAAWRVLGDHIPFYCLFTTIVLIVIVLTVVQVHPVHPCSERLVRSLASDLGALTAQPFAPMATPQLRTTVRTADDTSSSHVTAVLASLAHMATQRKRVGD